MSVKKTIPTKFTNQGHIFAAVGAAVGIANLVLFPARVFNYGGLAFILAFILCTFLLGIPLMIAETALGKSHQSDAITTYQKIGGKHWRYAGMLGVVTNGFVLSFYIIVAGWALYYLSIYLFSYQDIVTAAAAATAAGHPSIAGIGGLFGAFVTSLNKVLLFSGVFMIFTVFIVANDISKGIERVSKNFVPFLLVLIIFIIIAIPFVVRDRLNYGNFAFDVSALFKIDSSGRIGIIEAVGQAFFSLALGACTMITFGSHLKKDTNVVANSHYIVHIDTVVALLGALLVLPLFAASDKVGLDPTLVFISLVDTFQGFGEPWGRIIGISFFTLFNFAIVTSTISMLEPSVAYFTRNNKQERRKYALLIGGVIFILSIPAILSFNPENSSVFTNFLGYGNRNDGTMGYFNFILDFFGTFTLLVGTFLLSLFIRSKWSIEQLMEELTVKNYLPSKSLKSFLSISLLWITPIFMVLLFVGEFIKLLYKLGMLE